MIPLQAFLLAHAVGKLGNSDIEVCGVELAEGFCSFVVCNYSLAHEELQVSHLHPEVASVRVLQRFKAEHVPPSFSDSCTIATIIDL